MLPRGFSAKDKRELLAEWIGGWFARPRQSELENARRAKAAVRTTPSGSLISPAAIAVIDVLGMKDLIATRPLEEIAEAFAEPFFEHSNPNFSAGSGVTPAMLRKLGFRPAASTWSTMISDTLILVRPPEWLRMDTDVSAASLAVFELSQSVSRLISLNTKRDIHLRAAIAYGECVVSLPTHLSLLGTPLDEAIYWEKQQNWVGGMLAPSAVNVLRRAYEAAKGADDFTPETNNLIVPYGVPLKGGPRSPPCPTLALNWTSVLGQHLLLGHKVPVVPPDAPSDVRQKIENTIAFCAKFEGSVDNVVIDWEGQLAG